MENFLRLCAVALVMALFAFAVDLWSMRRKKRPVITFDRDTAKVVVEAVGYTVDAEGFIIEKESAARVLATDGKPLSLKELGGIRRSKKDGGLRFFRSDTASLIELSDELS